LAADIETRGSEILTTQAREERSPLAAAGERRVRQILMGLAIASSIALLGSFIYLWHYRPVGVHLYFELQRKATLIYIGAWLLVSLLAAIAACGRRTLSLSFGLILLLCLEGASHIYYYLSNGLIYHPPSWQVIHQFDPHPLLVAIPHPNSFGGVSHDDQNRRTTVNEGKIANPKRIFAFGGSTTYDLAVADAQTWPSDLSRILGPGYEVQNYGVPGYTSNENMIQSLFRFRDSKPVCAVYYEGWNDVRYSHMKSLKNDYSDYHLPNQVDRLGVGHQPGALENNVLFIRMIVSLFLPTPHFDLSADESATSGEKDLRLSKIFMDNMKLIAEIDRHFGVKPLFVPQILNFTPPAMGRKYQWLFVIPRQNVPRLMQAMNEDLERAARESGAVFIGAPLAANWTDSDFIDDGHFTAAGSAKFAQAIAGGVAANCQ
jgi:lysophospholipase L1-like esterase